MATDEDPTLILLQSLSHPLRKMILDILDTRSNATFTELLFLCSLDNYFQKGLLDYHLKNLSEAGIVARINNHYMLSGIGRKIIGFFNQISREHEEFLVSKRNKVDLVARSEKKVKILVRKLHESNLIIDSYIFPVGERRKYHTRHFPSESPFKDFYETEECLEEIVERDRKCKVIQRTFSEPYPGWCKVFRSPRTDGLYVIRAIEYHGYLEDPAELEHTHDPPWIEERFPLKAGLKGREKQHEEPEDKEIITVIEWEIIGDYEVRIGSNIYDCILKRSVIAYLLDDEVHPDAPQFVTDTYCGKGLLKVLGRRWDRLSWMKKVGYKNWEECPTLKYKDQVWYLTDETYLAEITSNL